MRNQYAHFGWPVSPYSAKTRAYFRFKQIPFSDRTPSAPELLLRIQRAVGKVVMPTVRQPDGRWLQDTSEIIDVLEKRFPERAVIPRTPKQRLASLLLELHGDEWLCVPALHYRWNVPSNAAFAIDEFGRYAVPYAPRFIQRAIAKPFADKMRRYPKLLGVSKATIPGVERFTKELIARLDAHLAETPFLLGSRPCIGDFALFGPLWAHIYRDVATTNLFDDSPNVRDWFDRLLAPAGPAGEFVPNDDVPESLDGVFETLFAEQFAYLRTLVEHISTWCSKHRDAERVPRALGEAEFTMGGTTGQRKLVTFSQWMLQRPLDAYRQMNDESRASTDDWLRRVKGHEAMQLVIEHRLERKNFRMVLH